MSKTAKWSDLVSRDGPRTLAAANRLLPFWFSLLLVIVVGWQLARIGWALFPGTSAGDPVAIPAGAAVSRSPAGDGFDVQAIAAAHLFGEATEEPVDDADGPAGPVPEELDETRQNLTLTGIVAATDPELSAAIIEDASKNEKAYQIGDTVVAGATLHAVERERVVLDENGVLTSLTLPDEFADRPSPIRRTARAPARPQANTQSIQSVVAQNVSRLADVIRPTPYFVNGQQQGYRVYPGRNRQQFAALGLRPGDLIRDIDGQALNDPTQAMKIFQSLGSAEQVSVTVERDGQPQALVLKTSQLDLSDEDTQ
ncbi:MAG: type II secretion system protein GspC [Pseudomonadota bacterium]